MNSELILTFYINSKLDLAGNIKLTKLGLDKDLGLSHDVENKNELIHLYSSTYKTEDIYETLEDIIKKLSKLSSNGEIFFKDSTILSSTCFSRCMIVLKDIELEERKINFTDNPHAQHIHIFNRDGNGMIRVKEQKLKALLDRTIDILQTIKDEI